MEKLIFAAREMDCSDIHLTVGEPTVLRVRGELIDSGLELSESDIENLIYSVTDDKKKKKLNALEDLDFSFESSDGSRQRINIFRQRGKLAASIRILQNALPTLEELNIPQPVIDALSGNSGIIVISGPSGSGKTTTLAAMTNYINQTRKAHIITVEKPLEYIFKPINSTIHQREVGVDVTSQAAALKSAIREDPDVIIINEINEYDVLAAAMEAAESGHLIITAVNTSGAAQAMDMLTNIYPGDQQLQFRMKFAFNFKAIIGQMLLPAYGGQKRIPINEVLLPTDAVLNLVRQNKGGHQMLPVMQSGASSGMRTFNLELARLSNAGIITPETALQYTNDKNDLMQYIKK